MQLTLDEAHDHARALLVEEFCRKCGLPIYEVIGYEARYWNLVWREQDDTRVCVHDGEFDTAGHEPARIDWPETVAEMLEDAGRLSLEGAHRDAALMRWEVSSFRDPAICWPYTAVVLLALIADAEAQQAHDQAATAGDAVAAGRAATAWSKARKRLIAAQYSEDAARRRGTGVLS